MDFREKPDHQRCVAIVTRAALKEMRFPGVLCIVLPVATGLAARFVGEATNRPLLGAQVQASPRPHNPVLRAPAAAHADRPLQPDHGPPHTVTHRSARSRCGHSGVLAADLSIADSVSVPIQPIGAQA